MVFSKKLAGALAVAATLAVAPTAGASPGPANPVSAQTAPVQGSVSQASLASCLYWRNAAQFANDEYWLALEFPDDWPFPGEDTHGDGHDGDFSDAYAAFQYAVQQYERLGCRALLGPPPEWGLRE